MDCFASLAMTGYFGIALLLWHVICIWEKITDNEPPLHFLLTSWSVTFVPREVWEPFFRKRKNPSMN